MHVYVRVFIQHLCICLKVKQEPEKQSPLFQQRSTGQRHGPASVSCRVTKANRESTLRHAGDVSNIDLTRRFCVSLRCVMLEPALDSPQ